jgi:hypothetical protein
MEAERSPSTLPFADVADELSLESVQRHGASFQSAERDDSSASNSTRTNVFII